MLKIFKSGKRGILFLFVVLCLLLGMFPTAFAENGTDISIDEAAAIDISADAAALSPEIQNILDEFIDKYAKLDEYGKKSVDMLLDNEFSRCLEQNTISWTELMQTQADEIIDSEISPVVVDFDGLVARCSDTTAWLYCPNTVINYPVVSGTDNAYYQHIDIDGNYSAYGTLFTDCNSINGFPNDENNIIYGHHMRDGKMFACLIDYKSQSYYDSHPVFYLNTPEANYRVEVFAGYVTSMYSDAYRLSFENDDIFTEWINNAISQSFFTSDVEIKPGDKILTLSTCTYDYDEARFVLHGKMIRIN